MRWVLWGVYSTIRVTIGGYISSLVARWLIGQTLTNQFYNRWATKIQTKFDRNGWKFVAFARINPIIPTRPLSYLLGITSISNNHYLGATFVFLLFPATAFAYFGETLQTFTVNNEGID
jgi:uncharacterized membrane protein YdjX (TVP38/TMEM64 family)